jgi:hypothetical protein
MRKMRSRRKFEKDDDDDDNNNNNNNNNNNDELDDDDDNNADDDAVDDISKCRIINIYRNSLEPAPPCNTSVKEITLSGKIADPTSTKHIYINEYKEDPRVFTFHDQLYISYNKVYLNDKGFVKSVKVFYSKLNKDLTPDPEELTFPILTNTWEKNWLFFEYKFSHLLSPSKQWRSNALHAFTCQWKRFLFGALWVLLRARKGVV